MFTGIVQGLGKVLYLRPGTRECRFCLKPMFRFDDMVDGESIAVNGVCLSMESHSAGAFIAYASAETMSRTNLARLHAGNTVNLERALSFGERLGGHLVSGHIDCVATVTRLEKSGQSIRCAVNFPPEYAAQVILKGSVALDGISLTVNNCGDNFLEVNVIPESQKRTNFDQWRAGSIINMETDLIGKYVLSFMRHFTGPGGAGDRGAAYPAAGRSPGGIGLDTLITRGFM